MESASADDVDPLDDLRAGWQSQIAFGVANPALFRLLSDPTRVAGSPGAQQGRRVLEARVHRIAAAGRLRVSEPRAVGMIPAGGVGVIQTLLATPPQHRDPELAERMYEAVLAQILTDAPAPADGGPIATAVTFRDLRIMYDTFLNDGRRNTPLSGTVYIDADRRVTEMEFGGIVQK